MMKWFASWLQRCRDAWENYEQINRQRQEDEFLPAVLEVTETRRRRSRGLFCGR